jgi:hypothetical protein
MTHGEQILRVQAQPFLVDVGGMLGGGGGRSPGPADWRAWLEDSETRRRFEALTFHRGPGRCAYWLGAISSTGHGKFRAGSRARQTDGPASRIVTAHVYAYQQHYGVIPDELAGWMVIRHQCDETSCQNWEHLVSGSQPDNVDDWRMRRGREVGPLADQRGARGRAVAIRDAIRTALQAGADPEAAIAAAAAAGIPAHQERLF